MWGHAWDKRITMKDYRAVRVCTGYLAFGSSTEYARYATRGSLEAFVSQWLAIRKHHGKTGEQVGLWAGGGNG